MTQLFDDPAHWPIKYPLIAHDVGRSNDRSTAVVGGYSPFAPGVLGIKELVELPQNCFGHALANQLALVDARHNRDAVIIVDLSNNAAYAEVLFETFGRRIVGVLIGPSGDGTTFQTWQLKNGVIPVYHVGRTFLFDVLLREFSGEQIAWPKGPMGQRAFAQLAALEPEMRANRMIYKCPPGQHDDLAISCAMLAWAASHPHLQKAWVRAIEDQHRPRRPRQGNPWKAFV